MTPQEHSARCEAVRRCKTDPTVLPVLPRGANTPDYATGMLKLGIAMHHLEEALPNRQSARVQAAMESLREGARELEAYLLAAGYTK